MKSQKVRRQSGLWDSPVTPISLARGMGFSDLAWDTGGELVWLESRSGRGVLVVQPPDGQAARELTGEFSVRARVGYGGGDFSVGEGFAYFVDADSGRIFRQPLSSGIAQPVTPAFGQAASPALSPDGRWLIYVHSYEGQDRLAIVDAAGMFWPQVMTSGCDFYMQPVWHPDSKRIAWIEWNHPNMPWDGTTLCLASLQAGKDALPTVKATTPVMGGTGVSIFQPQFSPDGRFLAYVSDESGWWQLYLYDLQSGEHRQLTQEPAEHGVPAWTQAQRTFAFAPDGQRLYFLRNREGWVSLWQLLVDTGEEQLLPLNESYTNMEQICAAPVGERIGLIASGGTTPARVITYQPSAGVQVWRRATSEELPRDVYSAPQPLQWQGLDGGKVHGLFYPPHSERFEGVGEPPLIVIVHGGPTSQRKAAFSSQVQFFTSRGFAVLEPNFRGSTGYGRAYRNALHGNWGLFDVQDSVSGARALVDQGRVDPRRLVIMGGSSGGYTVLKAMEDYPGFFKAGVCLFGISNQFTLAAETHKFEAHYSDHLLGPLPEAAEIYYERSPIFFIEKMKDPIAIFQGDADQVVPRNQSDAVVESLRRRGVPHIYHVYPEEGHGFRKPDTIEHFYRAVDEFLRLHVIFAP